MALINLSLDLSRIANLLERLVCVAERAFPPPYIRDQDQTPRDKRSLVTYGDPEKRWKSEQAKELIHGRGFSPDMEEESIAQLLEEEENLLNPQ